MATSIPASPSLTEPRILSNPGSPYPPGPHLWSRLLAAKPIWQNPIDTLTENARRYGDLVHFRALDGHVFQFNHPTLIQELLTENEKRNRRVLIMQRARSFLGDGLLTSEEPLHMRQRRMAAPAFHRQRITAYADAIAHFAAEVTGRWQPGVSDMHPEMLLIALRIVGKTLFDIDDEAEALAITDAFNSMRGAPPPPAWIPEKVLETLQKVPFGPMLRVRQGMERIDSIIYGMIAERRKAPGDRGDLLSMLLEATDPEADEPLPPTEGKMSDKLIRDECLTIILAGHETTANVLSFAMDVLARHPEVQEALHQEAVRVLGARRPQAADYPSLKYAYMVFAEVMRLFPTVWVIGRSAGPEPYDFHGFTIPPKAALLAPQIVVHRDPRFWDDPETFNPLRFAEDNKRPRYAYFPFGGGSRQCIGEALAWMEGVFTLATIARDWRLEPVPGAPARLPLQASINLRPKNGVPVRLIRR
jgi:cytochrome P450